MVGLKDTFQLSKDFIKNYNEESDEVYVLEVDFQYLEKLDELHNDLPFLPERMKIEKVKKLVANFYEKFNIYTPKNIKQALNCGLISKKMHRIIKFKQKAWLKSHIDMNADLRKKAKNDFEKDFFKLMNNVVFGKTMENVRKHENIKRVTTERRKNYLLPEPNYHTTKFFVENLFVIEMEKMEIITNKLVYLALLIL